MSDGHEPGCSNAAPPGLGCGCGLLRCTALDRDGVFLRVEWVWEALVRRQGLRRGRDRTGAVKAFLGMGQVPDPGAMVKRAARAAVRSVLAEVRGDYRHVTPWIPLSRGYGEGD